MSSVKIEFPDPERVAYTTERRHVQTNPVVDFLSDYSSTRTLEQIYSIKQITDGHLEVSGKRKYPKKGSERQLVCPPILDISMNKRYSCAQHPVHKHKRIFNGFFPSRIRTSTNMGSNFKDLAKEKQESFEDLLAGDATGVSSNQNVAFLRTLPKNIQQLEPTLSRASGQQNEEKAYAGRRVCLRNGSPSPWISRYQIKKKSISASNAVGELKSQSVSFENICRGFSR